MSQVLNADFAALTRPTILQIVPTLDIGGAERTTVDMARAIVEAHGRAIVVSSGGRLVRELEAVGAEHIDMAVKSKNPVIMALNVEHLTRLITRGRRWRPRGAPRVPSSPPIIPRCMKTRASKCFTIPSWRVAML